MVEDVQKLRAFINGREGLRAVFVGGGLINVGGGGLSVVEVSICVCGGGG